MQSDGYMPTAQGVKVYLNGGDDLNTVLRKVEAAGGKVVLAQNEHRRKWRNGLHRVLPRHGGEQGRFALDALTARFQAGGSKTKVRRARKARRALGCRRVGR